MTSPFESERWSAAEALARMALPTSSAEWKHRKLGSNPLNLGQRILAGVNYPDQLLHTGSCAPWKAQMEHDWPKTFDSVAMSPCQWVRWAISRRGSAECAALLSRFGSWLASVRKAGEVATVEPRVVKRKAAFSISGVGPETSEVPVLDFVLGLHDPKGAGVTDVEVIWPVVRSVKTASVKKQRAAHVKGGTARGTTIVGNGVARAVHAAVVRLSKTERRIQPAINPAARGPRFEASSLGRQEMFELIRRDSNLLKGREPLYRESTVLRALSSLVKCRSGRAPRA